MFSIITPLDSNRLEQFRFTKKAYDKMPQRKEFVIPTREISRVQNYLLRHHLMKDVVLLPYEWNQGFNCSKALNLGVRYAKYNRIIITSPEVKPMTKVLEQLAELKGENVVCQVFDQNEDGSVGMSLVNRSFRSQTPAMYFLAVFNKKDIETINGWDEEFMKGYAYEDDDFGARWVRAGLPFIIMEDIQALHQYHPRTETIENGFNINALKFHENNEAGIIRCKKGLMLK